MESLALKPRLVQVGTVLELACAHGGDPNSMAPIIHNVGSPDEIMADPDLLGIALDALIDNARRYDSSGMAVELSACCEGRRVLFSVADHGPGVAPGETERIFEKYYRSTTTGSIAGTGLGLYLVRKIAQLHGGDVSYQDRQGGGAVFILSILADCRPPARAPA